MTKLTTKIVRRDGGYFLNLTENGITVELGKFDKEEDLLETLCEYKRARSKNRRLVKTERTWANIIARQEQRNFYG